MKNPERLWYDLAYRFAEQSKCRSRQVGCVIVSPDQRVVGQGYNGAPHGSVCADCPRCRGPIPASGTSLDLALCAHAEANAIGYAARRGTPLAGCTLYCTTKPCLECAKLIVAAGITKVVFYVDYVLDNRDWAGEVLTNGGVRWYQGDVNPEGGDAVEEERQEEAGRPEMLTG